MNRVLISQGKRNLSVMTEVNQGGNKKKHQCSGPILGDGRRAEKRNVGEFDIEVGLTQALKISGPGSFWSFYVKLTQDMGNVKPYECL